MYISQGIDGMVLTYILQEELMVIHNIVYLKWSLCHNPNGMLSSKY